MKADFKQEELQKAQILVSSIIDSCESIQPKFEQGSSQHTLLKNRIRALRISQAMMSDDDSAKNYSKEELVEALGPISSIISKCEKARQKSEAGTANYTRMENIIKAMGVAKTLIEEEVNLCFR